MNSHCPRVVGCMAALVIVTAASGCATKRVSPTAGRDLVGVDEAWAAAASAGNVDAAMEYWADHAVMYAPGLPPLHGKEAIRELILNRRSNPGYRISWTPSCAGVDNHGQMAYTLGAGKVTLPDQSGVPRESTGRYVAIWQKEQGRWKCAVKCWTPSP